MKYKRGDIIFFFHPRKSKPLKPFSVDMIIEHSFRDLEKYILESLTDFDDEDLNNSTLVCIPLQNDRSNRQLLVLHWEE